LPNLSELVGLVRLASGLSSFASERLSADQCGRLIRERMRTREARFVHLLDELVFRQPNSPYYRLLKIAGAQAQDVRALVASSGVEGTLEKLSKAGVRVSWDEFKGRTPVVRGSSTLQFKESDFDNPVTKTYMVSSSSGTSGRPVRVKVDLEFITESAPNWGAWFQACGWQDRPLVFWTPTHTGLANRYLMCTKLGYRYKKWFAMADMRSPLDRLRSGAVHRLASLALRLPRAVPAGLDQSKMVMSYLADQAAAGVPPLVNTSPSAAARVSRDALHAGRSLSGICFLLGAEPVTVARRQMMEASRAACYATYGTAESGWIGAHFNEDAEHDEVRVFRDSYAVLGDRPESPDAPQPLVVSSLVRTAGKVLINVGIGDSAFIQRRTGDLPASQWGYDLTLHTIRSFRKITSFGITLAVADLYPVIESFLPKTFGGKVGDYQLIEKQSRDGVAGLTLLVDPRIANIDDSQVVRSLLREIGSKRTYYRAMADMVEAASAVTVERTSPRATANGKVFPVLPAASA
jgi:hypothetical protein